VVEDDALAGDLPGARLGWLTPESCPASLFVDYEGNGAGPLRARTTVAMTEEDCARAVGTRQPVALLFENGDRRLPIVVGVLREAPSPLQQLLVGDATPAAAVDATLDGHRVALTAEREIVLTCGAASLTLRRDGKVIVRGTYVETHAAGTNRIKGGQVKIN
jgi:hypothetical protein